MAKMSLQQLNDLLDRALRELHQEGLSVVTYQEPKPWLPESYWAQVDEEAARATAHQLIDLAEQAKFVKKHRAHQDAHLAERDAATVMAEWDDDLPRLKGADERLSNWGVHSMRHQMWHGTLQTPTAPDAMQPVYNNVCQFCFRPITTRDGDHWKDHGGRVICPDRFDGQYDAEHVPDGVDVDDEYDDD